MKHFVFFITSIFFVTAHAAPSFESLGKQAAKQPVKKQKIFWKKMGGFMLKYEKALEQPGKAKHAGAWIFQEAFAEGEDGVWCMNNAFFARVPTCEKSNNWSFDVRETESFKLLAQAGIADGCTGTKSPCSLAAGLSSDGSLFCSNNSTRTCLSAGGGGGFERLSTVLKACSGGQPSVTVGSRVLQCGPLVTAVQNQMRDLDSSCGVAVKAVRKICESTRAELAKVVGAPEIEPEPVGPVTDHNTDVLFIGDSNSTYNGALGCFGGELYDQMSKVKSSVDGQPMKVQMEAACASSAQSWLADTVATKCGYRQCTPGKSCYTTPYPESAQTHGIDKLLANSKPRVTVLQLGTNMLGTSFDGDLGNEATINKMIDKILASGSKCVWVGPPEPNALGLASHKLDMAGYRNFVNRMKSIVTKNNRCKFIDSDPYTDSKDIPASDPYGVHYNNCGPARNWARGVFANGVADSLNEAPSEIKPTLDEDLTEQ